MIVDDEEIISQLIMALLNRSGNIDIAHNGRDALKLMETKYYKFIISDIDMPGWTISRRYHCMNSV